MTAYEPLVITLISASGVADADLQQARDVLQAAGAQLGDTRPFDAPFAMDLQVEGVAAPTVRTALESVLAGVDVIVQPASAPRRKRLFLADMDSTMIQQECIDELADFAGLKAEIAAITERAMQGELDFSSALKERVQALAGLETAAIRKCLDTRIELTPGARTLVATMKAQGVRCVLVSGGFTAFTGDIAGQIGFDRHVANVLGIDGDRLDGTVAEPIVDSTTKRDVLQAERAALGLSVMDTLAIGDGANDIPMLREAGLGIAYHAKAKAAAAADSAIRIGDLTTVLWAQGIAQSEWVQD